MTIENSMNNGEAPVALDTLQTSSARTIIDLVDTLRRRGLQSVLSLPQIVVTGDQSSGKSSVLEAISGIPFPRKESLCTRFATEIVMRPSSEASILAKVTPDKGRTQPEKEALLEFFEKVEGLSDLSEVFEKATQAMGLDKQSGEDVRAFAADVLSIEICGPGLPQLTLVDLPGLIHSRNKAQSQADVDFIRKLVKEYISNERTIILAVISAKNDYANQIILEHCRKTDPLGVRTLGIITKPDFLKPGSENEQNWINLALNSDVKLERGWHFLKNRSEEEMESTLLERNAAELDFFAKGRYEELPPGMTGIEDLKTRLCELLEDHLKKELPGLQIELKQDLQKTNKTLLELGRKRSTLAEQRRYLLETGMAAHDILKAAVRGNYDQDFFGDIDLAASITSEKNSKRLRAAIQHKNLEFAETMRNRGHKFEIARKTSAHTLEPEEEDHEVNSDINRDDESEESGVYTNRCPSVSEDYEAPSDSTSPEDRQSLYPLRLSRATAINWVLKTLQRSRGHELPGTYNPLLIGTLFWEQSSHWETLAEAHIDAVAKLCKTFVNEMLDAIVPASDVRNRLKSLKIRGMLDANVDASRKELSRVIADKKRHPMTYNHHFTTSLQKMKHSRYVEELKRLDAAKDSHIQQDMDTVSAEDALDGLKAYYKDESKYFVDTVTKQVIERHLACPLPDLVSPVAMAELTDDQVRRIASEPRDIARHRRELEDRKAMLEAGEETFRLAEINDA